MTDLSQIIYASAAQDEFKQDELNEILTQARNHNQGLDISGILVYRKGSFLQVLEGPKTETNALYKRICQDARHTNIKLIFKGDIDEKDFEDWSMGFVDTMRQADQLDGFIDYATELSALTLDDTRARQVLKKFTKGIWRQAVSN
ncbi:BLUF domain-containing protein [Terasakiella sp. A23]|uniref:BLUF domain-containing protein n=1 Tax=Terasakiella sp. FCG-A23 TaxID=3080561 RepID=UPI002954F853|nr:BLUF domain-containing protein [Terasakiella sp. A23]MDV7339812.1 BLUF domain-containing protein [Terasakiella sp. A23]